MEVCFDSNVFFTSGANMDKKCVENGNEKLKLENKIAVQTWDAKLKAFYFWDNVQFSFGLLVQTAHLQSSGLLSPTTGRVLSGPGPGAGGTAA